MPHPVSMLISILGLDCTVFVTVVVCAGNVGGGRRPGGVVDWRPGTPHEQHEVAMKVSNTLREESLICELEETALQRVVN